MITLTDKEALYIAAMIDAQSFIGINNGFLNMSSGEITNEIINIQNSLIKKSYAELGFDGEFNINKEVQKLVSLCTKCNLYTSFDIVLEHEHINFQLYVTDDVFIKNSLINGMYQIEEYTKAEFCGQIETVIKSMNEIKSDIKGEEVLLSQLVVESVFDESQPGAIAKIKNAGATDELSKALYSCINEKKGSIHFIVVNAVTGNLNEITGVISDEGVFILSDADKDYESMIKVTVVSFDELLNRIRIILKKENLWEEVGFI